jgi:hypothetical protein
VSDTTPRRQTAGAWCAALPPARRTRLVRRFSALPLRARGKPSGKTRSFSRGISASSGRLTTDVPPLKSPSRAASSVRSHAPARLACTPPRRPALVRAGSRAGAQGAHRARSAGSRVTPQAPARHRRVLAARRCAHDLDRQVDLRPGGGFALPFCGPDAYRCCRSRLKGAVLRPGRATDLRSR